MSLFKNGDKVVVVRPKVPNQLYGYNEDMEGYLNKTFTVYKNTDFYSGEIIRFIEDSRFIWDSRCLELAENINSDELKKSLDNIRKDNICTKIIYLEEKFKTRRTV